MQNSLVKMRQHAYHCRKLPASYYICIVIGSLKTDDTATTDSKFSQGRRGGEIDIDTLIYLIANPVLAFIDAAFDAEIISVKDERKQHHLRRDSQIIECLRCHFSQDGNADLVA